MDRVITSARNASVTGEAFVLEKHQSKWVLEAIDLADAGEKRFAGYKSLMVHLWFKGQGDKAMGVNKGAGYLAGCLHTSTDTIKALRLTGQVRWACLMQGLPLDLFSDSAVKSFKTLLGDADKLGRKYHKIIDGYWIDRERIKQENKAGSSRFTKAIPKYITSALVERCLESAEDGCYKAGKASTTSSGIKKPDSGNPATSTQTAVIDDGEGIDDMGRVRLLLADAEEAVEILAGRLSRQKDVQALKLAVHRVADQARAIRLSDEQADVLWEDRQ